MIEFETNKGHKVKEFKKNCVEITLKGEEKPTLYVDLCFLIDQFVNDCTD